MAEFDRVVDIYDTTRKRPDEVMGPTVETMANALGDCKAVLDVGVGTGRFAKPLHDRGINIVGTDISIAMMKKAREKGVRDLVRTDVHNLPFKDESFDASIVILVLHLVRDWVKVLGEIVRVTKGKVVSLVGRTEGPQIRKEYLRLRVEAGYRLGRFDEGEEGLRQRVPPAKLIPVSDRWIEVDADERISYFEKRGSSITWDLPEDVHRTIIEKLRTMFGGKVLRQRSVDELAIWEVRQLGNKAIEQ